MFFPCSYPSACFTILPSPCWFFFSACVDVNGTHSNVHLCCFNTGKSTAMCAALSPWKWPVSTSDIIIISLICVRPFLDFMSLKIFTHNCPFNTFWAGLWCQSMGSLWYQCIHAHCHSVLSDRFVPLVLSKYLWTWTSSAKAVKTVF